jgi:hypothetical protein
MSDAHEVLQKLADERARTEAETRRWDAYRKLCGPARWFMVLLAVLGMASFALVLEALNSAKDQRTLVGLGRIGLVIYAVIWPPLLMYVEVRRRRGLKKILAQEAPELAAKLKDERIL